MEISLKEVLKITGGKLIGDENLKIKKISPIDKAEPGDITFLSNKKYIPYLKQTKASAIILDKEIKNLGIAQIVSENPYLAYAKLLTFFTKKDIKHTGVSPKAFVDESSIIPENVTVYPGAYIGKNVKIDENTIIYPNVVIGDNCKIGKNCIIYANVSIYHNTIIGDNVIIHAGTVIGSDGFGYAKDGEKYFKIPQIGNVIIEDDVEIGANCTIDRGAIESTKIGKGVKIDNLVQIAHNVEIGENSVIVAQVGISGSTKIGKKVVLAGQVGIAGHIKIGDNVMVGAKSGIGRSLRDGSIVSGIPVIDHKKWLKWAVSYEKLPELIKKVKELEKKINEE